MIDAIKTFIIQYRYIFYIAIVLLEFILSVLLIFLSFLRFVFSEKKSPYVKEFILEKLPALIAGVEYSNLESGSQKKTFVIEAMMSAIKNNFPKVCPLSFSRFISENIEKILSTPQKKED